MLFREGAAARAAPSHSCTVLGIPLPCISSSSSHMGPLCRSWGTYFILKMAVSQEQKPCAETRQKGLPSCCVSSSLLSLSNAQWSGWCSCTSTDMAWGRQTMSTQNMQSHGWAKEMTVLLHGAQHRLDSATWLFPANRQLNLPGDLQAPG